MKGFSYYCCPECGNVIVSASPASISCCGLNLGPLVPVKAEGEDCLEARREGDEFFVKAAHPMTKTDYITFIALESWDGVILRRLFPEWDAEVILPFRKGRLVWYSAKSGAFFQDVR